MSDLRKLATPFPPNMIEKKPGRGGGDYVTHSVVNEYLLRHLGAFDLHLVEVIRGYAPEVKTKSATHPARDGAVVGCVARLTVTIDGQPHSVEEVGSEDNPATHSDAENLKNAMSDALKRCAMRFGLGLHLWSQEHYTLDKALGGQTDEGGEFPPDPPAKVTDSTLNEAEAQRLTSALNERGVDKILDFASDVTGRKIKRVTDLTKGEARNVFAQADGQEAVA